MTRCPRCNSPMVLVSGPTMTSCLGGQMQQFNAGMECKLCGTWQEPEFVPTCQYDPKADIPKTPPHRKGGRPSNMSKIVDKYEFTIARKRKSHVSWLDIAAHLSEQSGLLIDSDQLSARWRERKNPRRKCTMCGKWAIRDSDLCFSHHRVNLNLQKQAEKKSSPPDAKRA